MRPREYFQKIPPAELEELRAFLAQIPGGIQVPLWLEEAMAGADDQAEVLSDGPRPVRSARKVFTKRRVDWTLPDLPGDYEMP